MKSKIVFLVSCFLFLIPLNFIFAQTTQDQLDAKKKQINELESKIHSLQEQENTLSSQIKYMNSQIQLTELKIGQTEEQMNILERQVDELSKRIGILDVSLDEISSLFINRVVATYKVGKISSLDLLLSSRGLTDFVRRAKYLQAVQVNDRQTLVTMEEMRADYDRQKQEKEEKQRELEALKNQLAKQNSQLTQQKKDKEYLLTITRSDEKKYQNLMAQALAELQAIQAIVAGKGEEKEVGSIKEGEKIASIIAGVSPCSTGTHLHFEVRDGETPQDPAVYLKNISVTWSNQPDGPFSFSGSWPWPITEPVKVTQGYGYTFYARVQNYYGGNPHTGIDVVNSDLSVNSVKDGTLYNGSIKCGSGYLRYVRIKHKDSNLSTYYLHVNYEKV